MTGFFLLFMVCLVTGEEAIQYNSSVIFEESTSNAIVFTFPGHHDSAVVRYNNEVVEPIHINKNSIELPESERRTNVTLRRFMMTYRATGKYQCTINETIMVVYVAVVSVLGCEYIADTTACYLIASHDPASAYDLRWNIDGGNTTTEIDHVGIGFTTVFPGHHNYIELDVIYRTAQAHRYFRFPSTSTVKTTTSVVLSSSTVLPSAALTSTKSIASVVTSNNFKYALLLQMMACIFR